MILERLSGRCVDKVICTPGFADVQYIHDMLKSVFTALERAQSWLGRPPQLLLTWPCLQCSHSWSSASMQCTRLSLGPRGSWQRLPVYPSCLCSLMCGSSASWPMRTLITHACACGIQCACAIECACVHSSLMHAHAPYTMHVSTHLSCMRIRHTTCMRPLIIHACACAIDLACVHLSLMHAHAPYNLLHICRPPALVTCNLPCTSAARACAGSM